MLNQYQVMRLLNLTPLDDGLGYYRQTYRSEDTARKAGLPPRYNSRRSFSSAYYYLLTPNKFSAIHRLSSDEIYHFYLGDPIEMLLLYPDGSGQTPTLGVDLLVGQPQHIVPAGVWQGFRLRKEGTFALLGTVVAPGFEHGDFEIGKRKMLLKSYPEYGDLITKLTRD